MTRYQNAKKRPAVYTRTKPSKRKFSLTLLLAFLIGYLAAWLYAPSTLMHWVVLALGPKEKPSALASNTAVLPKPQFEFYSLLTQEKNATLAPEAPARPPERPVERSAEAARTARVMPREVRDPTVHAAKHVYVLQLASFQRKADAEQMKAALIMRGLDVTVKQAVQNGQSWHRVLMGPFDSRLVAEKTQQTVADNEQIPSIIIRMDA